MCRAQGRVGYWENKEMNKALISGEKILAYKEL